MNDSLKLLMDFYGGGTGNLMLYYDMETFALSGATGVVKNVSPSATVGYNNAFLDSGKTTGIFHNNAYSGGNLSYSKLTFDTFNNGFLDNADENWSASFLFSFTKTNSEDGVLFGCLNKDEFTFTSNIFFSDREYVSGEKLDYGRGFNIGINDRNQLFLQAIDLEAGPYVIVADQIELANKNLCAVSLDPFTVTFSYYDLPSDRVYSQTKLTTDRTENILSNEKFYLGSSNFYYKNPGFSGYIDKFAILSGDYNTDQLKSIISGFVSTNAIDSGEQGFITNVTGYEYNLIQETGITGYAAVLTGYRPVYTTGYFFERVQSTGVNSIPIEEGYRFISGFTLSNNLGYDEEVGYLYKTDEYKTSGNMAHATLGLIDHIDIITTGGKTVLRYKVNQTGSLPLFRIDALTGFLGPTGVSVEPLTNQSSIDGAIDYNFYLNTGLMQEYRHNYLYYLMERI
jgi:hypothetical protein